ncbi:intraflagellar transport protein 74 homolog [Anopheles bellator]|uniref:intraflagellar transport protein 74 homolog n=1 Tax=Anopheles bellator TaxID=139047 RepID=UPI0026475A2F|nr:intraflagellar transport protein 74 homolog [Anopheles bellator]
MEDHNNNSSARSDRPSSRRGAGENGYFGGNNESVAVVRPRTAMKPPSAVRGGTASRLATNSLQMNTATSHRIGTALGYAGNRMNERPITQHGISGLSTSYGRLGTSTSGNRQIKDKRYWQAVLQSKIQEITQETDKLLKEKKFLDRERSARKLYEGKVKEAAKELTNLQSTLTSMNLALDNCSSGMTRQHLLNETVALRERNEHMQEHQLEQIFRQFQRREAENRELEVDTEKEKNKINEIIMSLPAEDQRKYRAFQTLSENLKKQNTIFHSEITEFEKQKERLTTLIMNSQSRSEAHRLKSKLKELMAKRNAMADEETNRLSPAQEREKLISEVRSNNQSLDVLGKQQKIVEDQLNEKRETLQQIEQDLEEGNSERHVKYKELKKRDDVMSSFMDSFSTNMAEEKHNIEVLKNQITFAIERITSQGINIAGLGEDKLVSSEFTSKNDLNSHAGLIKEYKKLGIQLKQLQILEKRTLQQVGALRQEESETLQNIQKYANLEVPRSEAIVKMNDLSGVLQELEDKKRVTDNVIDEARKRNQEIKNNLKSNETYRLISHLEDKLVDLMKDNKTLQESVDQLQEENDYNLVRETVNGLVDEHNKLLCSDADNERSNRLL